ncbi:hypothetical protein EUGRSUZ_I00777 [Eucalyptus grandis]|uniref:Uncharacterized protein n=1 Tax=Eucalyptus grandis TaxID=71139 RepID=A0ACC3JD35_EUCGR|nr:hypothetical protein EUGRSUZ_I00777 [Eucalyptus grandis]
MTKLLIHGVHVPGSALFFISLQYPLLLLTLSPAYATQTKHFINCGSSNSINYVTRNFVGDASSDSVSFTKQNTSILSSNQSSSVSAIYNTARIFRSPSSRYVLDRTGKGTHIVRLHFFPFASTSNLSEAVFNVSVNGLTLLSTFQVPSTTNSPVVEEFFLSINRTNPFATHLLQRKTLIGSGGFGNVYRGTLRDGTKVAVKRSQPGSGQGFSEFQTELTVLSKIRHRHLVSLIGYCAERLEMILVYEFMEKGSLRDHLYNSDFPFLAWKQRLEICIGAARGLNYLHKGVAGGIIHRDIKSTNILLDENYVAKVADFGLSKLGPLDQSQTHVSTAVKGTFGYFDPEYFMTQQLTEKSDVYSFGVVLLEVLCARPSIDPLLPREQANLAEWGITCIKNGNIDKIVDPVLAGQINPNSLRKYGEVAEKCLQEEGKERPSMRDVLLDLEFALQLQQTALKRKIYGDSATGSSPVFTLSNVRKLPSSSAAMIEEEGVATEGMYSCEMSMSEVFPR